MLRRMMMADGGGVQPSQTVFSATLKSADIIVSNGGRDVESNAPGGGGTVLSDTGKSSGQYYFEIITLAMYASNNSVGVGIHRGTTGLANWLGADASGWAMWDLGTAIGSETNTGGSSSYTSSTGENAVGVTWRVAVDIAGGKLWLANSARNSGAWIGGGDPAAGTSPTYSFTPAGNTFHIAACPRRGDATNASNRNRLRIVNPSNWAYAAPTGFGVWE